VGATPVASRFAPLPGPSWGATHSGIMLVVGASGTNGLSAPIVVLLGALAGAASAAAVLWSFGGAGTEQSPLAAVDGEQPQVRVVESSVLRELRERVERLEGGAGGRGHAPARVRQAQEMLDRALRETIDAELDLYDAPSSGALELMKHQANNVVLPWTQAVAHAIPSVQVSQMSAMVRSLMAVARERRMRRDVIASNIALGHPLDRRAEYALIEAWYVEAVAGATRRFVEETLKEDQARDFRAVRPAPNPAVGQRGRPWLTTDEHANFARPTGRDDFKRGERARK